MRLIVSVEMLFLMHTIFLHFFAWDLQHNSKKKAVYWLGGLWRELTVGRGEENERGGSTRKRQLLDDTQMHFAYTEHRTNIMHSNTKKNSYFRNR